MSDQTVELLRSIAERLGMEAARVWPQIVMVTWVQSVFWAIVCPIVFLAGGVGFIATVRWVFNEWVQSREDYNTAVKANPHRYVSEMDFDCVGQTLIATVALFICGTIVVASLSAFPGALAGALFPEAQTVLRLAGK